MKFENIVKFDDIGLTTFFTERSNFLQTLKIFLSETKRLWPLIFGIIYPVDLYQDY